MSRPIISSSSIQKELVSTTLYSTSKFNLPITNATTLPTIGTPGEIVYHYDVSYFDGVLKLGTGLGWKTLVFLAANTTINSGDLLTIDPITGQLTSSGITFDKTTGTMIFAQTNEVVLKTPFGEPADNYIPAFDGTTGKIKKSGLYYLSPGAMYFNNPAINPLGPGPGVFQYFFISSPFSAVRSVTDIGGLTLAAGPILNAVFPPNNIKIIGATREIDIPNFQVTGNGLPVGPATAFFRWFTNEPDGNLPPVLRPSSNRSTPLPITDNGVIQWGNFNIYTDGRVVVAATMDNQGFVGTVGQFGWGDFSITYNN